MTSRKNQTWSLVQKLEKKKAVWSVYLYASSSSWWAWEMPPRCRWAWRQSPVEPPPAGLEPGSADELKQCNRITKQYILLWLPEPECEEHTCSVKNGHLFSSSKPNLEYILIYLFIGNANMNTSSFKTGENHLETRIYVRNWEMPICFSSMTQCRLIRIGFKSGQVHFSKENFDKTIYLSFKLIRD